MSHCRVTSFRTVSVVQFSVALKVAALSKRRLPGRRVSTHPPVLLPSHFRISIDDHKIQRRQKSECIYHLLDIHCPREGVIKQSIPQSHTKVENLLSI